jgi:hypothetical protein
MGNDSRDVTIVSRVVPEWPSSLHAKGINLHIRTGICAGVHRPNVASIADKMLFMVASMAAGRRHRLGG